VTEKVEPSFDDQKRTSVSRVIVDGEGRPLATITADDTPENVAALARLERLGPIEREALGELVDELHDLQETD
jgi:hypothetical protein